MPGLTDPMPAMQSFQAVLRRGLRVECGRVDSSVGFHCDQGENYPRFVYVRGADRP
jgi:hypothetical protein